MRSIHKLFVVWLFVPLATFIQISEAESCPAEQHPTFRVSVSPELGSAPLSGRLIVMMSNQPGPADTLAPSFGPDAHSVWVAAKEVHGLTPQTPVDLDPDELAYPAAFCSAPAGNYKMKAVLDVDHNFAYYDDASDGDLLGVTAEQNFNPAANERILLTLTQRQTDPPLQLPPHTELIDFVSPALSEYWGRPIHMRAAVVLPPSYGGSKTRYPTAYLTHGFGADMKNLVQRNAANTNKLMEEKKIPEMIWVMLLEASPTGTHEFADSVNNGPWGKALTTELIPYLEKKIEWMPGRTDASLPGIHPEDGRRCGYKCPTLVFSVAPGPQLQTPAISATLRPGLISPEIRHQIFIATTTVGRECSFAWVGKIRKPWEIWLFRSMCWETTAVNWPLLSGSSARAVKMDARCHFSIVIAAQSVPRSPRIGKTTMTLPISCAQTGRSSVRS